MSRSSQRMIAAIPGLVFLVTGGLKVWDPAAFAIDIQNYRILPWSYGILVALYLPWVEILCGAAMLLHVAYRGALGIAAAMLAVFIAAYSSTRLRGLDIACGCFGHGVHRGFWQVVIGDVLLLVLVAWLLKEDCRPLSPVIRAGTAKTPETSS